MQIYKTTNLINGKIYIGKQIKKNKSYLGSGKLIKRAILKYGKSNFSKEIIDPLSLSIQELNKKEVYWIKFYNSTDLSIGYNISDGGDGGDTFTNHPDKKTYLENKRNASIEMWKNPEYRKNFSLKHIGLKRTQECKDKLSLIAKDKPKSEEHKKSLSKAWEKRKIEHPHSKETLNKMSNSMLGKNAKNTYKLINVNGEDFIVTNLSQFVKDNKLQGIQLHKVNLQYVRSL